MPRNPDDDREIPDIDDLPQWLIDYIEEGEYYDEDTGEYDLESFFNDYPEAYDSIDEDYLDYLDSVPEMDDEDFYSPK